MHPNSVYRQQDDTDALALATKRGFGVVTAQLDTLFGGHVPFVQVGERLHLHFHRGNPLAKAASKAPVPIMLIVSLCDAYVSPDWYAMDDQVPTWIYGAVHIHGTLKALPDEALESLLIRLSDTFEARLAPKPIWTMDKMTEKAKIALMRAIQPFEIEIEKVESTDKFAQNKPVEALESLAKDVPNSFGANLDLVTERVLYHAKAKAS